VREYFASLGKKHLDDELVNRNDVDSAATMVMLNSAIQKLVKAGVEESKLQSKLRRDPSIWPGALEIIAGSHILTFYGDDASISMDHGGQGRRNCDFRIAMPGFVEKSIEFKAVGLSEAESGFFQRSAAILPSLCPKLGVAHAHSAIEARLSVERSVPNRKARREKERAARKRLALLPAEQRTLAAAAVVGHYTEQTYLERARSRIQDALGQLDPGDECWVSLWWNNGASSDRLLDLLETIDFPSHVLGIIVTGSAVILGSRQIHHFTQILPRPEVRGDDAGVVSLVDNDLAALVFDIVEQSAGPRPTLIVDPSVKGPERAAVLFRDGQRSQFPFNLILDSDPNEARAGVALSLE
jgi:hypothetical protein